MYSITHFNNTRVSDTMRKVRDNSPVRASSNLGSNLPGILVLVAYLPDLPDTTYLNTTTHLKYININSKVSPRPQ